MATSVVVATMRCAELLVVREAGLGYEICFGAGVAGARRDAATETQVDPAPGVLATVPEPAEARHRGMKRMEEIRGNAPQPLGPLSALGAVLMALLMQQPFTVHRYTKGTLMTPATQTMPGLRLLLSAYTLTVRTMCR